MSNYGTGGSANISGIDYQIWFSVFVLIRAMDKGNFQIKPENPWIPDENDEPNKVNFDDLTEIIEGVTKHYSLKQSNSFNSWTINRLKKVDFFSDVKKQMLDSDSIVVFVSDAFCPLKSVFEKVRNCEGLREIELRLNKKEKALWNSCLIEFEWEPNVLFDHRSRILFEFRQEGDLRDLALEYLRANYPKEEQVLNDTFRYVIEIAKRQRTITRQSLEEMLSSKGHLRKMPLTVNEILDQFNRASSVLKNTKSGFGKLSTYHTERVEFKKINSWLNEEIPQNSSNILIVKGEAGSGKSVLMRDLLQRLEENGVPVLGIKADKYKCKSLKGLHDDLGFKYPIDQSVNSLLESGMYSKVVVIIDQLDALSKSLTHDRKAIESYGKLIAQIVNLSNGNKDVRIVFSSRSRDLKEDPDLKKWSNSKTIEIGNLTETVIKDVLDKLDLPSNKISSALMKLLQVPLHLDIFASLDYKGENANLETIEDLYDGLWKIKITAPSHSPKVEKKLLRVLYDLSSKMMDEQQIFLPEKVLRGWETTTDYLLSAQILELNDGRVSFFHQTFFDYTYARLFVENDESIQELLKKDNEGLFIRSKLRTIFKFLRVKSPSKLVETYRDILENLNIRFHIKVLILELLATQTFPSRKEKELFSIGIATNPKYFEFFFSDLQNPGWLKFLIHSGWLKRKWEGIALSEPMRIRVFAWRLVACQKGIEMEIIQFLLQQEMTIELRDVAEIFLSNLRDWSAPASIQIAGQLKGLVKNWIEILANAALFKPKWAEMEFRDTFEKEFEEAKNQGRIELFRKSYLDINSRNIFELEFFKNLFSKDPLLAFSLACEVFERLSFGREIIKQYEEKGEICLIGGTGIVPKMLDQLPSKDEDYTLEELIRHWLVKISSEESHLFKEVCHIVYETRNITLLLGIVMALNEAHEHYSREIIELFQYLNKYGELFESSLLTFHASKLVARAFPFFSDSQRKEFRAIVMGLDEIPKRVIRDDSQKVITHFLKYNGLYKYNILKHFTEANLDGYGPLIKLRNELNRKAKFFKGTQFDTEWKKFSSPIPKDRISSLSVKKFIETVLRFKSNRVNYDTHRGGKEEYSREFGIAVKERPDHFVPYLQELIRIQNSVPAEYIAEGLSGLMEAKYSVEDFEKLLISAIDRLEKDGKWISTFRFIGYLIDNDILPNRLFESLEKASQHTDPKKQQFQSGQRFYSVSVRGEVARIVPHAWKFSAFEKRIWNIVNRLSLDPILDVRISLINKLGILTHLDRRKTYKVFIKMIQGGDPDLLDFGGNLFAHFTHHYWEELRSVIKNFEQIEKFQFKLGQIIFYAFLNEYNGAESFLGAGIKRSNGFLAGAFVAALNSLSVQNSAKTQMSIQVLENNIRSDKKLYDHVESQILNTPEALLDRLIPFFEKYFSLLPPDGQINYSLDYLKKAIDLSPRGVIQVLGLMKEIPELVNHFTHPSANQFCEMVVASFSKLRQYDIPNDPSIDVCLGLIDWCLKEQGFKREMTELLKDLG